MNISSLLNEDVILHTPWPALVAINALNERVKQLKAANEKLLAYLHEDVTDKGRTRSEKECAPRIFRANRKPKNQGQADRDKIIQSFCSSVLGLHLSADEIQKVVHQVSGIIQCLIANTSREGHGTICNQPEQVEEDTLPQAGCRRRSLQRKRSRIWHPYRIPQSGCVLEKECPSDHESSGCTQAKADSGLEG